MSAAPTNGAMMAFPIQASDTQGALYAEQGLLKREYIATAVLQGLAAGIGWSPGLLIHEDEMADDAVTMADALLARLSKPVQS
jgi:hypothetical protein